jgi:hypothetical protein
MFLTPSLSGFVTLPVRRGASTGDGPPKGDRVAVFKGVVGVERGKVGVDIV